ncbi:MAG: aminotransferase class V-fold PLP-dependent enzyme [Rhodocyclaceae bacterium]|nr:aminotransferase class V-fold PLP-dependent enzyme [Rhodocyclaceae bacterium]
MATTASPALSLAEHFACFARGVVGNSASIPTAHGPQPLRYADWTASGRAYAPLEERLLRDIGPYIANTHTETSFTGQAMTRAYQKARDIVKRHVNAGPRDVLLATGTGCTGTINKLQRMLGLRAPSNYIGTASVAPEQRPLVLITHMEHHSNHTSWLECEVELEVIPATADGLVNLAAIPALLARHAHRPLKIASVTACSNVTGISTPYHQIAALMHAHGGLCFVDFACSAPYVAIDMHPADPMQSLDAIFFSPHKFLGGPGSCGILVFNGGIYSATVPDQPGGGTVTWTNPWQEHRYYEDIEVREDGGTPGFLQLIRAAMAVQVKESMGIDRIAEREHAIVERVFAHLERSTRIVILAARHRESVCRCFLSTFPAFTTTSWCACSTTALACRRAAAVRAPAPMGTTCSTSIRPTRTALLTRSTPAISPTNRVGCGFLFTR